jgi:thioesterase domain-containing protein/acyl carrier protein
VLVDMWRDILSVDEVGATDNFFVLGGHSLLAVRLFARIEERFGLKLPLTTLFRGASIEQLAAVIDGREEAETPPTVVPVRPEGSRPPLFIIGGIDGEVIHYRRLVSALHPDQPVYALQPEALRHDVLPKTTMEEMAADYVRDLVEFLPDGPYLIAGYCYSGYVAYEVARQLHELGVPPSLLALIDTGPGLPRPSRAQLERQKFSDFRERDLRGKLAWIERRRRGLSKKIEKKLRWTAYDVLLSLRLPMPAAVRDLREAGYRAWAQYVTRPAPVKLTLFRAVEAGRDWRRTALWSQVALGGVEVVPLHGNGIQHDNLMWEPHVRTLAEGLEHSIERVLSRDDEETPALSAIA